MTTPTASPLTQTDASTWLIDAAHTTVEFQVKHMMFSTVKGRFSGVTGSIVDVAGDPTLSSVDVEIDALSLSTGDPQRDGHLKSADFFDVARFPSITFQSNKVVPSGADSFDVVGDLTIHGVTQQVPLTVEEVTPEAKDPWGNMRRGATARTKVNRKDFGLHWNVALEAGGFLVGEEIEITIDVELIRQAA